MLLPKTFSDADYFDVKYASYEYHVLMLEILLCYFFINSLVTAPLQLEEEQQPHICGDIFTFGQYFTQSNRAFGDSIKNTWSLIRSVDCMEGLRHFFVNIEKFSKQCISVRTANAVRNFLSKYANCMPPFLLMCPMRSTVLLSGQAA